MMRCFFSEELCEVMNRKAHIGFVDKEGKMAILRRFDWVSLNGFQEGLCLVARRKGNEIKLVFINENGKMMIDCSQYDYVWDFKHGYAPVHINGLSGLIDKTGKEVVVCKYANDDELPKLWMR